MDSRSLSRIWILRVVQAYLDTLDLSSGSGDSCDLSSITSIDCGTITSPTMSADCGGI